MDVLTTPAAMRSWSATRSAAGRRIGFVPTMGALHAGHLSLVEIAAARADEVVVSIFVNPLQFDRAADFDAYPRPIDDDVERCRDAGVHAVYAPTARTMYPAGFETHVEPGSLGGVMEGAARPGHFRGVTTVVAKLFAAVRPDVAVFGEKDFQQLAVIRRMACDLDLGIEIVGAPIVRDPDGLAMSSRNVRLDAAQRAAAACVPRALDAACASVAAGESLDAAVDAAAQIIDAEPLARLEYVEVFDPVTLRQATELAPGTDSAANPRVGVAVWFGDVRLIDNRSLR
jgi:pantoate--beta-alanine ligase